MFDLDQLFWSARNRIEYCLITPADIYSMVIELSTQYLPPTYSTQMADQCGQIPEDYIIDLELLPYEHYSKGI